MQEPADGAVAAARHHSALGAWERAWQRPSAPLRGLVAGYTGFRQRLAAPATHRGIPGPTLPLVLSFGPPQRVSGPGGGPRVAFGSFLAGLHERYVLIDAEAYEGIQVDLYPTVAQRLLGQPLRELTNTTVPLDALLGPDADRLVDDLATAPDWPSRFRPLDRYLRGRLLADAPGLAPEVARVWERIVAARGQVRVGDLAEEVGWSQRHLAARVGGALGLPPKRLARIVRLDHAAGLLARPGAGGLAEIAVAAGYYDQAHLANELRAATGLSPKELLARRLPDGGGVFDVA